MQLAAKIRHARTALSHRRTVRHADRQLAQELAAFASVSDRAELDHILERYPADDTRQIRTILSRQDAARRLTSTAPGRNSL
jgi:hypothetical protein